MSNKVIKSDFIDFINRQFNYYKRYLEEITNTEASIAMSLIFTHKLLLILRGNLDTVKYDIDNVTHNFDETRDRLLQNVDFLEKELHEFLASTTEKGGNIVVDENNNIDLIELLLKYNLNKN